MHLFLIEHCIADNADLMYFALISLPMGLPLLVASTDNKLDLCLELEDCTADVPRMTRQLMLHWNIWDVMASYTVYDFSTTKVRVVCVCVNAWALVCAYAPGNIHPIFYSINPNLVQQEFNLKSPHTHLYTHIQIMQAASLIPVMIH